MSDGKDWWVRPDNLIRLGQVPHGETAWECVYLKRDYDDARAEKAEAVAAAADRHALACRNEVDAFKLARDTAEDRIVDLGNRLLKAEAERDKLAAECEGLEAENVGFVQERDNAIAQTTNRDCQIIALRAERDKLAATVKRVRVLMMPPLIEDYHNGLNYVKVRDLQSALAAPVKDWWPCCLQHPHHVHCCHPERRGTTGDRRQGERRDGYGFAPDRRKAQRRKA